MTLRRIMVQEIMSVDGFVADPSGGLDFFEAASDFSAADQENLTIMATVDTLLLGAKTYRMFVEYWPTADHEPLADAVNTTSKIVFSSTMDSAPWGRFDPAEVLSGDAVGHVQRLRQEPGGDIMVWGSISLVQTLLDAGLVDELQLRVLPVVLSRGRRLIDEESGKHQLTLLRSTAFASGIVSQCYAVGQP